MSLEICGIGIGVKVRGSGSSGAGFRREGFKP